MMPSAVYAQVIEGGRPSNGTGEQHTREGHAGDQPEHRAHEHTRGHEWNPDEQDQAPESPAVDALAIRVGDVLDRGEDVSHELGLQQRSCNSLLLGDERLSRELSLALLDATCRRPVGQRVHEVAG